MVLNATETLGLDVNGAVNHAHAAFAQNVLDLVSIGYSSLRHHFCCGP